MAGIKLDHRCGQLLAIGLLWSGLPVPATPAAQPVKGAAVLATPSPAQPSILHLSDVHLNTSSESTTYGVDTGLALWRATKLKLDSILNGAQPPRFVIYTGDLPAHYSCSKHCYLPPNQRTSHNANMRMILADLRDLVAKSRIPLFFVPGNNDGLAGDYFSFADRREATPFSLVPAASNPYPALNTARQCGKAPCLLADPHPKLGYYAARPIEGLRLIGLNTIIWGTTYWSVDGISQRDAGNTQMAWLAQQLKAAAAAGEKVYILMHIPPGLDAYAVSTGSPTPTMWAQLPTTGINWQDQFLGLVDQHAATVTGLFYGHTHMDEVRLLYDRSGQKVTQVAISSPGVTPLDSNNPGFKLISYDPTSTEPTDFVTHYTTPAATSWGAASYRFSDAYGCGSKTIRACLQQLTPAEVTTRMNTVFTVMNGLPTYATGPGIPVKFGQ